MGFWKRLFGKNDEEPAPADDQHAVLIHIRLGNDQFGDEGEVEAMHALQDEIESAIGNAGAGELDGDEFGAAMCTIYTYGPDAEELWEAIMPVLEDKPFRKGSYAIKRFGAPGVGREERVNLNWNG